MDTADLERRISALKSKRDTLVTVRAEKVAQLKRAQEDFKALYAEAESLGYNPKELGNEVARMRKELEDKVAEAEKAMAAAEAELNKYNEVE